jgi:NACHT domain
MISIKPERVAGGAANAAGMNFQAAITTIANIYMARGQPLGWMPATLQDVPVAVEVETGSGGDDLRLYVECGATLEIQAKKGLAKGAKLWTALLDLATEVAKNGQTYGLLAVSTTSSGTIRTQLANDIVRLGDGCTDGFSDVALEFVEKLKGANFAPAEICKRLRIHTVAALTYDQAAIAAAKSELGHLCERSSEVGNAWNALYADSSRLIEQRGRRDVSTVLRALTVANIDVVTADRSVPAAVLAKLSKFNFNSNATFSILGVKKPLQTDRDWIKLTAVVRDLEEALPTSLADALHSYHAWESRTAHRDAQTVDPETLARFVKRGVLVAGPGMGKTTLLKRIARRYSEDNIPVLKVRLGSVAARMRNGAGFEESVFQLGLDGSGLAVEDVRKCRFSNWLLLCDGLDECGSHQEGVAAGVAQLAIGYPECRIIVTTRPVGYRAGHFSDWRHYDLAALSTSAADAHTARLVEAIADEKSATHEDAWDICRKELKDTAIAEVIGRTPLLVGLAAAIISSGAALANSREALFEQIFELIDSIADVRPHNRPASPVVLRRFVDILGWQLAINPLREVNVVLRDCGKVLATDLNIPPLQAESDAQSYATYWEQVGLIERLGFESRTAFAFIHKSFGEFAASRFLCALPDGEQDAFIAKNALTDTWAEPLRFAASMGLADKIAGHFVANYRNNEQGFEQLVEMLRIVAEAKEPPNADLRAKLFALAIDIVAGSWSQRAYKIGKRLATASMRFPNEVGPLTTALLASPAEWTSHVAWHCAVASGPKHYSLQGLVEVLERYVADASPRTRMSRDGMLMIDTGSERDMTQDFALAACAEVMDRATPETADGLVPKVLNHPSFGSVGFVMKAEELVRAKGKSYKIGSLDSFKAKNFGPSDEYREAERIAISSVMGFIGANATAFEVSDSPKPLLNLSAFFEASQWMKMPASDCWSWSEDYNTQATREVIHTFIEISGIDPVELNAEAIQARRHIEAERAKGERWWSSGLFDVTTTVDPKPIQWTKAKSTSASKQLIEAALSHPSEWLVCLAANLLNGMLEPEEREPTVKRLFDDGSGNTLWAASALASELPNDTVIQLIYDRLRKPLVGGCRHLFNRLGSLAPQIDQRLVDALQVGIFSTNEWPACAAAESAKSLAVADASLLLDVIERGVAHWQVHKRPYPAKGGVVPNSPRDALAAAKAIISPPTYAEIRVLIKDRRHDICKLGESHLIPRLSNESLERAAFLNDVLNGDVASRYLVELLQAKVEVADADMRMIIKALESENRNIRLSAMAALDCHYFDADQISALAQKLSIDSDQQVRERAFSVLEGLNK